MNIPRGTVLGIGAVLMAGLNGLAAASDDGTMTASWQEHKLSFPFMGFTTTYSCDGLADKLKSLLIAAGARSDLKVRSGACANGFGQPDRFARADVHFWTLAPASSASGSAKASAPVSGTWKPVAFSTNRPNNLQRGDCELVEQFAQKFLPLFTTRNVVNNTHCIPHQDSGSSIDLRFETLVGPKQPAGAR